jgi:translation factor GUF1, mitochondrial
MPGFKPAQAMVYAGVFPVDNNDFLKLEESIKRVRPLVSLISTR